MKSTYFNIMASLLVAGTMSISCKTDKENTPADMSESTVEEDNAGAPVIYEAGDQGAADMETSDAESQRNTSGSGVDSKVESQRQIEGTSVNKAKKVEQGVTGKGKKSLKGYGAPDGTDAENHDGDQYTKHDTTRMPSGSVSIK